MIPNWVRRWWVETTSNKVQFFVVVCLFGGFLASNFFGDQQRMHFLKDDSFGNVNPKIRWLWMTNIRGSYTKFTYFSYFWALEFEETIAGSIRNHLNSYASSPDFKNNQFRESWISFFLSICLSSAARSNISYLFIFYIHLYLCYIWCAYNLHKIIVCCLYFPCLLPTSLATYLQSWLFWIIYGTQS